MRLLLLLLLITLTGCETYYAPDGKSFPWSWGEPPEIQTRDHVRLPDDYGYGSSTLKNWIELNQKRDRIKKESRAVEQEINKLYNHE